jgi:hypothetical protein
VLAIFFGTDYLIGLYLSKNKKKFFIQTSNIIDLLTILPVFVSLIPGGKSGVGDFLSKFIWYC